MREHGKRRLGAVLAAALLLGALSGCQDAPAPSAPSSQQAESGGALPLEAGALYKIVSGLSGRVMEADNFGYIEGSFVQQQNYRGDLNQLWKALPQEDGTYRFENQATGGYMTLKKNSKSNKAPLCVIKGDAENPGQTWRLEATGNEYGEYRLRSAVSDKPAELEDGKKAAGTRIVQNEASAETGQLWRFEKVDDGSRELPRLILVEGSVQHSSTPEIVRYGETYYSYIMAGGIPYKTSKDLRTWEVTGTAFPTSPQLPFAWMEREVPGGSIWAPGVYQIGDRYYLYYCISTGGSQNSAIGVAVNTTLDHTSPDFKWVDKGMVIRSHTGDPYNCIDPNIILDESGQPWLVFGSWWTGVKMRKIDPATGMLASDDTTTYELATRENGIEAPYMIKRGDYYYLFAAFGRMDSDYHYAVGRSKSMFGPFVDKSGKPMLEGGGTAVTESKEGIEIPGHASVFRDNDGQYYLVSEYFREGSASLLLIGTIVWDENGWPVTALTPDLYPAK